MNIRKKIKELKNAGDVTIEQVKACKIFRGLNDEAAKKVVEVIRNFTTIVFDYYHRVVKPKKINDENDIEPDKLNFAA